MSNPEQGFADPITYQQDRRPINTDPREQPQWQAMSAPIMAQPPHSGHSPWRWLGVSVLILAVIFGGLAAASVLLTHQITASKNFTVGNQPALVVTTDAGDVHIFSGPANQISVTAHQRVFVGNNDSIPVHYGLSKDGNTLTVSANENQWVVLFSASPGGIDFDITVPSSTNLNIHTDSGDITSNQVDGQMTLTSSSGDITTDAGSNQISLTSSSGDIKASNVSGQMKLNTSSGNITVLNGSARGNSTFQTSSGDVIYRGTLDPNGIYEFVASSGDVDLTLPGSAAFQVQATTDSGSIHSDFSGVSVVDNGGSGASAVGTVGGPPSAKITIQTSSGDIHLRKA
jgi:Toastrack DUF4097